MRFVRGLGFPLALTVLVLAAYAPAINGTFVWDDDAWSTRIAGLLADREGLLKIWTEPKSLQQFYPLTATSFWLDYQLSGFWTPTWHLMNIAWHLVAVLLFWRLLSQWCVQGARIAAGLFALHPMMVESVAWITERKNVLSQALVLGALLAFGRFAKWDDPGDDAKRSLGWYALALLLFVAALLAKISVVTVVPVMLLVTWWRRGRVGLLEDVVPLLPFFLISAVFGWVVMRIEQEQVGASSLNAGITFVERLLIASRATWFYLGKLLVPANLCFVYPEWEVNVRSVASWIWPIVSVVVAISGWRFRTSLRRGVIVAVLAYLITLLPVLGFVNVYGQRFSWVWDHWVYLSSLAFFAVAGALLERMLNRVRMSLIRRLLVLIGACGLVGLSAKEAVNYESRQTLWESVLADNPNCWLAYDNLGEMLHTSGSLNEAMECYQRVLQIRGNVPETLNSMGACWLTKGDAKKAEESYRLAIAADHLFARAHYNLGMLLLNQNRLKEAIDELGAYVAIVPNESVAHLNLGVALQMNGQLRDAVYHFERSLALNESNPMAMRRLAWIKATARDDTLRDGAAALALAKRMQSVDAQHDFTPLMTMAAAQAELGRYDEALRSIDELIAKTVKSTGKGLDDYILKQRSAYAGGRPFRDDMMSLPAIQASPAPQH